MPSGEGEGGGERPVLGLDSSCKGVEQSYQYYGNPATNGCMQKWKLSQNLYTLRTRFCMFGRRFCMLSWCLLAKYLHWSSVGILLRVCCWLGSRHNLKNYTYEPHGLIMFFFSSLDLQKKSLPHPPSTLWSLFGRMFLFFGWRKRRSLLSSPTFSWHPSSGTERERERERDHPHRQSQGRVYTTGCSF